MIEVGKVFIDQAGAGRLYLPKTVVDALELSHRDHVKLEVEKGRLHVTSLKQIN